MQAHTVDLDEAKEQLSELVEQALRGDEVVLTRNNEPIAKLVPVQRPRGVPRFGSAKGLITVSDDFDDPLEDFADYMR